MIVPCPVCGHDMPYLNDHGKPREGCSRQCAARAGHEHRLGRMTAEGARHVEDVEWLLGGGERPENIPARLGFKTREGLLKSLEHAGRDDLVEALRGRGRWAS